MSEFDDFREEKPSRKLSLTPRRRRDTLLQVVTVLTLIFQALIMVYPEVCGPLRGHIFSSQHK